MLYLGAVWLTLNLISKPLEPGRRFLDLFIAVSHLLTSHGKNLKNVGRNSIAWIITGSSPP